MTKTTTNNQPTPAHVGYPTLCTSMDHPEYCLFTALLKGMVMEQQLDAHSFNSAEAELNKRYTLAAHSAEYWFIGTIHNALYTQNEVNVLSSRTVSRPRSRQQLQDDYQKFEDEKEFHAQIQMLIKLMLAGHTDLAQMMVEMIDHKNGSYPRKREIARVIHRALLQSARHCGITSVVEVWSPCNEQELSNDFEQDREI